MTRDADAKRPGVISKLPGEIVVEAYPAIDASPCDMPTTDLLLHDSGSSHA
jgi:hypothetical protein